MIQAVFFRVRAQSARPMQLPVQMDPVADVIMDRVNRSAWRDPDTVVWFRGLEGWSDRGERAAFEWVAREARGGRILDIGVGAGRTVPALTALSSDYVGIDYTPELVAVCHEKHPGVDVRVGDARDLSAFADGSFRLVVFSFNGIDAVSHKDRAHVFAEVRRVLAPGGLFFFSTHNRRGPLHHERFRLGVYMTRNPFKLARRVMTALRAVPRTLYNRVKLGRLGYEADGYSVQNASAHSHGILIHYVTLEEQRIELEDAGFEPNPVVFSNVDGRRVDETTDVSGVEWFHLIARARSKPVIEDDVSADSLPSVVRSVLAEHGRLGIPVSQLSDDDDLFEAGLKSHASVNVLLALERKLGLEFPETMFQREIWRTIRKIAAATGDLLGHRDA